MEKKKWYKETSTVIILSLAAIPLLLFILGIIIHTATPNDVLEARAAKRANEEKIAALKEDSINKVNFKADSLIVSSNAEKARIADSLTAVIDAPRIKKEKIESQFSPYDGSHINLTKYIKKNMNDPDSYDHAQTNYWVYPAFLVVETRFRGKNSFGAIVLNSIKARVDLGGNIIKILD